MFLNKDIWNLVEHDIPGFQTLSLCNSRVVIHAHDFFNHVLYQTNHPFNKGGNYSQLRSDFKVVLNTFDQCRIRPIFVFGGISVSQRSRDIIVQNLQKRVKKLGSSLQQDSQYNFDSGSFRTPIFTKEILLDVIRESGVPHVTCDAEVIPACVALAAYLRCPLLANCCELFLFEFEEPDSSLDRFIYIPLRYFSLKPIPSTSNPNVMSLSAHVYSPSKCCLQRIPYTLRPFFAIYFRPPIAPHFPIPYRAFMLFKRDPVNSTRPMVQRAKKLISWLQSAESPFEVLEESIRQIEDKVIFSFIEELVSITTFLKIDLNQGEELVKFLFPDAPSHSTTTPYRQKSVDLLTHLFQQSCPRQLMYIVGLIKTHSSIARSKASDLLNKLPPYFLKLYRDGYISTVLFGRLLSNGVIVPILEENLNRNGASDRSMGLRFLQYCLALDFIKRRGYKIEHLESSPEPQISEFSRTTDVSHFILTAVKLRSLPALPKNLDDLPEICTLFLQQNTGCQIKSVNNWIDVLALTLTLWHKAAHKESNLDILEQPTALAVALIASVMVASDGILTSQHLDQVADNMSHGCDVNILHEISELQLVYISLISLVRFFNAVTICESTSYMNMAMVKLPQGDRFFSSSSLIHVLAATLAESPERKCLNVWIKKILSPIEDDGIVKKATMNLMMLTRTICELRSARSIEFDSRSEILPFSGVENQQENNKRPSVMKRSNTPGSGPNIRTEKVMNYDGNRQRVFLNRNEFNGDNGGPHRRDSGNCGPQKPNWVGNEGRKSFVNQGGFALVSEGESYNKRNKDPESRFKPTSSNRSENGTESNKLNPFISSDKETSKNPLVNKDLTCSRHKSGSVRSNNLGEEKTASGDGEMPALSTRSRNSFLSDFTKQSNYAVSEFGEGPINERDVDARKLVGIAASVCDYKPYTKREPALPNRKALFDPRNRYPNFNRQSNNSAREAVRPGEDTRHWSNGSTDSRGENAFRRPFRDQQQSKFQPEPSLNGFQKGNESNFKGGRRKLPSRSSNGGPRRDGGVFNKGSRPGDDKGNWKMSELAGELDKLASEFM